jgi:predicted TIM-barrel fold metal-dependent hydrolase
MKIDLLITFFPPRYAHEVIEAGLAGKDMGKRVRNVPTIADLDARFRVMDEFGEYCQFLTLPAPPDGNHGPPDKSPEFARIANDGLAELVAKYPDRFIGFAASLPMNNVDECLKGNRPLRHATRRARLSDLHQRRG